VAGRSSAGNHSKSSVVRPVCRTCFIGFGDESIVGPSQGERKVPADASVDIDVGIGHARPAALAADRRNLAVALQDLTAPKPEGLWRRPQVCPYSATAGNCGFGPHDRGMTPHNDMAARRSAAAIGRPGRHEVAWRRLSCHKNYAH